MKWFIYSQGPQKNHLFVEAKSVESSKKRLTRWSKLRKVNISEVQNVNEGVGYYTMTEASVSYPNFTYVDGSF